jgi:DNA excision repair protein ERCC-8
MCICWSASNEHQLYSGDGAGTVRLWDIRRSGCRGVLDMNATPAAAAHRDASAAGTAAASGGSSGSARKRRQQADANAQRQPKQPRGAASAPASRGTAALAHEGAVTALHATADDRSLVTAGADHRVRLWDAGELSMCK